MQTGRGQGMMMLNDALMELVKKKLVTPMDAFSKAVARNEMRSMLERAGYKLDVPGEAASPPAQQK
jgi:twitching motility protein PilT